MRPGLVLEPDPGFLFLTMYGTALSAAWLTDRVRGYVEAAGVGKLGACHLFRHTMPPSCSRAGPTSRSSGSTTIAMP